MLWLSYVIHVTLRENEEAAQGVRQPAHIAEFLKARPPGSATPAMCCHAVPRRAMQNCAVVQLQMRACRCTNARRQDCMHTGAGINAHQTCITKTVCTVMLRQGACKEVFAGNIKDCIDS